MANKQIITLTKNDSKTNREQFAAAAAPCFHSAKGNNKLQYGVNILIRNTYF